MISLHHSSDFLKAYHYSPFAGINFPPGTARLIIACYYSMRFPMSKAKTYRSESGRSPWNRFIYNNNTVGYIFASPFIIGFLAFTIIPMMSSLYYSCTNFDLINKAKWVGFDNYINLFKDERFLNSLKVTFQYVGLSVPLKLAFALFIAFLLTRRSKMVSF